MKITIRAAERGDLRAITDMVVKFREEHSRLIGGDKSVDRKEISEEVKAGLENKGSGYFLAEIDGEVVGYRSWEYRDDFYFTKELFVEPDYRRKGVARELIGRMEEWLREQGQEIGCISCVPGNIAMIELARSEGYEILNQIELRKDLTEEGPDPRGKREALGYEWDVL